MYINFKYIPMKYNLLWINVWMLGFNVYLSFMAYIFKPQNENIENQP